MVSVDTAEIPKSIKFGGAKLLLNFLDFEQFKQRNVEIYAKYNAKIIGKLTSDICANIEHYCDSLKIKISTLDVSETRLDSLPSIFADTIKCPSSLRVDKSLFGDMLYFEEYYGDYYPKFSCNKKFKIAGNMILSYDGKELLKHYTEYQDSTKKIPEGVESIDGKVFSWKNDGGCCDFCTSIAWGEDYQLYIPKTVKTITNLDFGNCYGGKVEVHLDPDNPYFKDENGCIVSSDGTKLIYCYGNDKDEYIVPEGVKEISITNFPNSGELGGHGYSAQSLKIPSIKLPKSLEKISDGLFENSQTFITVETNNQFFKTEGKFLLSKNGKILYHYFGNDTIVEIPDGVETILCGCRHGCKFKIPKSVKNMKPLCKEAPSNIIFIDKNNPYYKMQNKCIISVAKMETVNYTCEDSLVIPNGVKIVDFSPFDTEIGWQGPSYIYLPESVNTIKGYFDGDINIDIAPNNPHFKKRKNKKIVEVKTGKIIYQPPYMYDDEN